MRPRAWLALTTVLAACSATASSAPSEGQLTAPPSAPAATATAEPGEGLAFTWPDGEEPVVTRDMTGITQRYINPGAVIDDGGTLHMYPNLFTAWPGRVQVPHLTSTDGASWELASEEPALASGDVPYAEPGIDVSTGFVTDDGTWVLVFQTVNATEPWEIGIATAPGADGPWTVAPEPVLTAPDPDADGGLGWPSVVRVDGGYAMYLTVMSGPFRGGTIGMATSPDGLTWTLEDEAVLAAEAEWEGVLLDRPRAVRTDEGYLMVYAGTRLTDRGVAVSDDGVTWTRLGDGPAITTASFPVSGNAWDAALVERDGVLTYYLEIGIASGPGTQVYRATAEVP